MPGAKKPKNGMSRKTRNVRFERAQLHVVNPVRRHGGVAVAGATGSDVGVLVL